MLDTLNKVLKEVFSWILRLITVLLNRKVVLLKTRRGDERQQAKANNSFTRLCIEDHSVTVTLSKLIVTDVVTENCVAKPRHTYRLQSADCSKSVTLVGHLLCKSSHTFLRSCEDLNWRLGKLLTRLSLGSHTRKSYGRMEVFLFVFLQLFIDESVFFSMYFHKSCFDFVLLLIFPGISEDWFMHWSN